MIRVLLVEDDPMVAELNRIYLGRGRGLRNRGLRAQRH